MTASLVQDCELPADHFRVRGTFTQRISIYARKENVLFIVLGFPVVLLETCDRVFYLRDAPDVLTPGEHNVITWGRERCSSVAPDGYRMPRFEEAREFIEAYPELAGFICFDSWTGKNGRNELRKWYFDSQSRLVTTNCLSMYSDGRRRPILYIAI
jgi:hypothetical protein